MIKEDIRPYELSLWTLQDSFITVLKPMGISHYGQIEAPRCRIKNDGIQELNFVIPMFYYEGGKRVENPIWYNVINGSLIVNLRKLKLIFNKGVEGEKEEIFEFVIQEITEIHTDGQLKCEVIAEGLPFQELGKIGYKISLSSQDYINDYNEWYNKEFESEDEKEKAKPINNFKYWCDKIFENSSWTYEVRMDWSSMDGIIFDHERTKPNLRQTDKIYEEEYVSSWRYIGSEENETGALVPAETEPFKEKLRLVDLEKSNMYNLTQNLAKIFGVYCRYEYEYDDNYHIKGKKCIFYNNFLSENEGTIDIIYPYSTSKIERQIESTDIVTKLYVTPIEDNTSPSGLITIADASANKTHEDYILNFDYLYVTGVINKEQYESIEDYQRSFYLLNTELEPLAQQKANLENDLIKYQAQLTLALEGQAQAKAQMNQAMSLMNSITNNKGFLYKNLNNPQTFTLLKSNARDEQGNELYHVKITTEGVDSKAEMAYPLRGDDSTVQTIYGIRVYYYRKPIEGEEAENILGILTPYSNPVFSNPDIRAEEEELNGSTKKNPIPPNYDIKIDLDKNGNVVSLSKIRAKADAVSNKIVLTYAYSPRLHYQNIYDTYAKRLAKDEALAKEAEAEIQKIENKIQQIEERYDALLEKKKKTNAEFEHMMGPALREGSWLAESYADYGDKYNITISSRSTTPVQHVNFVWDDLPFEGEQLNYESIGVNEVQEYYPCLSLSDQDLKAISDNLKDLSLIYTVQGTTKYLTIGSQIVFSYVNYNNTITPVLLVLDPTFKTDYSEGMLESCCIGVIHSSVSNDGVSINKTILISSIPTSNWIESFKPKAVFPRLCVNSLLLKTSENDLIINMITPIGNKTLEKYSDYSVLTRKEKSYITIKPNLMLSYGSKHKDFNVSYALSNASLFLYLDAIEVAKTNSAPRVSYTLEVSGLNKEFIKKAYKNLNRIVSINDSDLKFNNVQGYISELELDLENPWQDEIIVQNYKTKFEDLFSSIVASTEQIKLNSFAYDNIVGIFTSGGTLNPSVIQNTLNQVDLTYAFQSGTLTIDEINGIWATSEAGVVAIRGGGIFCATEKDNLGNWIWNTGILPSGINASLITSGQIDTNLIKIYAGDNLRLQLNAEGLFAYNKNALGEAKLNQYVVHNSEGLFLVQPKMNSDGYELNSLNNKVEISWQGFKIRNNMGDEIFFADSDTGNLTIAGEIKATSGNIGNWLITERGLVSKEIDGFYTNAGIVCMPPRDDEGKLIKDYYDMLWVTGQEDSGKINEFRVTNDGTVWCNNIIASGFIRANSFIGSTSGDELNQQLRNITLAYDGARFSFQNRNYDGNYVIDPTVRYLFVQTNALSKDELIAPNGTSELEGYRFYYNTQIDDNGNFIEGKWIPIDFSEISTDEKAKLITWKPQSLTFVLKNDIMYLDTEEDEYGIKSPRSSIFFKVEKEGRKRLVDANNKNQVTASYSGLKDENGAEQPYIYSSVVQFFSESYGIGKFITQMEPLSYTFIEDLNNFIEYEKDLKEFYVDLIGFSQEEIEDRGYWLINSGVDQETFPYNVLGNGNEQDTNPGANSAEIIVSAEDGKTISIGGVEINPNQDKDIELIGETGEEASGPVVQISLTELEKGKIRASLKLNYLRVPEGGSVSIIFGIDAATRGGQCFRIRNGSDGVSVVLRSSSGTILEDGDLETELSAELFFGTKQVNTDDSDKQYYYVWKKDGVALSEITEKVIIEDMSKTSADPIIIEKYMTVTRPEIFTRKNILVSAADFGLKSEYRCDIFDSLGKGISGEKDTAIAEYLISNDLEEVEWPPSFYISTQPKDSYVKAGETTDVFVEAVGNNLTYEWYYKNEGASNFLKSDTLTSNTYRVEMNDSRKNRKIYCVISGDNGKTGEELVTYRAETNIVTLYQVE